MVEQFISSGALRPFKGGVIDSSVDTTQPLVVVNPTKLDVSVATPTPVRLVIAYNQSCQATVEVHLAEGTTLDIVELYSADSYSNITVHQAAGSVCRTFTALLSSSNASYRFLLEGQQAEAAFNGLFIVSESDHATLNLNTRHLVSDCKSNSLIKGISSDRATGEFHGLVYVAPDAQRTDAQQQNRNIQMDNSHIVALPQLEIYADDVRCSHGSTVGYEDKDALFYMQQRGIDRTMARRLQIEGFIQDVVQRCAVEPMCCTIGQMVSDKLSKL